MQKRKKINKFDLCSDDLQISLILGNLKSQTKMYQKLISALQLLGDFDSKINVKLYDIIADEEENNKKIVLYCLDKNDNILLFYGISSERKDRLMIKKIANKSDTVYDISLAKNFELKKENINFTKAGKEYDFKFGRLITDNKRFYSLFLGNNIGYQIEGDFTRDISEKLLSNLNKLEKAPNLSEYTEVFNKSLNEEQSQFSNAKVSAYENFERICLVNVKNTENLNTNEKIKKKIR